MSVKISEGISDCGIVAGNVYNKYSSRNPIVRWMMKNFDSALSDFVAEASPGTIHEIGCGEGYWVLKWNTQGYAARGSDISGHIIDIARENATIHSLPVSLFNVQNIYDLTSNDRADLVVCCEVLEHLSCPRNGLKALQKIEPKYLILSVPHEPIWRLLNMVRGKYLFSLGNTPGHMQHWSPKAFIKLVSNYFEIIRVRKPLPWTILFCRSYR